MVNLAELSKAIINGDSDAAFELTNKALEANVPANEILDKGLIPGLREVGDLFERGDYYLPANPG